MVRELTRGERDALLARLRVRAEAPTGELLSNLQRSWCFTQPFHNLDLLAGHLRGATAFGPEEAIDRCVAGLGGPCHVHAAAYLALLLSLGFEAHLAPATVRNDSDHLGITVRVDGRSFWCDPGNGQPYLEPFPTDGPSEQSHVGWETHSRTEGNTLTVLRRSPDAPALRRVYVALPLEERTWAHFATAIDRHHAESGYGPFIKGLRVVRIRAACMTTLRDRTLTEYRPDGFTRREISDDDLGSLIADSFELSALPVQYALEAWRVARASP